MRDATETGGPMLRSTPGQTVGPFFGYALPFARGHELVEPGTPGAVRLHGRVLDGAGSPVPDAVLEIWHADPAGNPVRRSGGLRRDGTFTGWGRSETDREGEYWFRTLEPGPTAPGRPRTIAVAVFARGLMDRLFTRIYLPDETRTLAEDPFLASLPTQRRATLVATREPDGSLRHDIRLQGEDETVFLDFSPPGARGGAATDAAHGVRRGAVPGPASDPPAIRASNGPAGGSVSTEAPGA